MSIPISVVIPTYKRPQAVLRALRSLQQQTLPDFDILVVDNAADQAVEQLVSEFSQTAKIPAQYLAEPRLGVHYARNTAAEKASGDLLLYTDDDVSFDSGWAAAYAEAFAEHPEMAAAGGPVRPIWERPPPQWLHDYMGNSKSFGILSLMEPSDTFQLDGRGYFFSCNMAIWKAVLKARMGFHPEATGDTWLGDGETGLNREMWAEGDLIGHVPEALVYHHIPVERMTVDYFCRRMANEGACTEYARYHKEIAGPVGLLLRVAGIGRSLVRLGLTTFARVVIGQDRFAVLWFRMRLSYNLSRIRYILRLLHDQQFRELVTKKNWLQ